MAKRTSLDRDAMWDAIRKKRSFTLNDIKLHTDHSCCSIKDFLRPLISAGYIAETRAATGQKAATYKLVRDAGKYCPRLDKQGKPLPPSDSQRMWSALRVMGFTAFDHRDLALVAKTEVEMTRKYVRFLQLAGYLHIVGREASKSLIKYVFIRNRNTGPRAPELRARQSEVYDPNIREVTWAKDRRRVLDVKTGRMYLSTGGAK